MARWIAHSVKHQALTRIAVRGVQLNGFIHQRPQVMEIRVRQLERIVKQTSSTREN